MKLPIQPPVLSVPSLSASVRVMISIEAMECNNEGSNTILRDEREGNEYRDRHSEWNRARG